MSENRSGWTMMSLNDVGRWIGGGTPSKANPEFWTDAGIPWVSPKDMKSPVITNAQDHITKEAVSNSATNLIEADSVLVVARSGILQHTLPVAVTKRQVALNQDLKAVRPRKEVRSDYLALALKAFEREILHSCTKTGTTVQSLEMPAFLRFQIPVAPLDEQRRIVAEIEKQFTRLDAGVAALLRTQAKLKRYRAAVLKAACEGRLVPTEAELARAAGREFENAEELLQRYLDDFLNTSTKTAGRLWGAGHVPDLTTQERANLPEGWKWTQVRDLGTSPDDAVQVGPMSMKSQDFRESGVPVLNVGCVQWARFDESKLNFLPFDKAAEFQRYRIRTDDVLFTRSGTVGRCAVAKPHQDGWLMTFHLLRARPDRNKCLPQFLRIVFEGAPHIRRQTREASIGSTRAGFNTNLLAGLAVPLPPLAEQQRIVAEVERRLSVVEELEAVVSANLNRSTRLRSAILSGTFEGENL